MADPELLSYFPFFWIKSFDLFVGVVQQRPVIDVVVVIRLAHEEFFEQPSKILVVRSFVEFKCLYVFNICDELIWEVLT
jgi:hypothetical protein